MTEDKTTTTKENRRKVSDFEEYWNAFFDEKPILVDIMQSAYSDQDDEMLVTTVGTGIAICLNNGKGEGALAHIAVNEKKPDNIQNYISQILDNTINQLAVSKSEETTIEAKLFGCANIDKDKTEYISQHLHSELCSYMKRKEVQVTMQEVGDDVVRRIHFFPKNGKVVRRLLNREIDRSNQIARELDWEQNQNST